MRAAARRMTFFMCDHKAGTHGVVFGLCALLAAALADSYAAQSRMGEAAPVFGILEVSFRLPGMVISSQAQVLVEAMRLDHLARIHLPLRIPDGFEFAEGLDQLRAKDFLQEF